METLVKLERKLAEFHKKQLPHLPVNGQVWLSRNIWWVMLIFVILAAVGLLTVLGTMFFAASFLGIFGGVGVALAGIAFVAALIGLAFSIVKVVLLAMAISPLKMMRKKGWDLVFLTIVISVVAAAVSLVLSLNIFGLFTTAIWAAIELYFLFEIRSYFVGASLEGEIVSKTSTRKAK